MSKNYGYVRVSTKEQNEARQMIALENIDIELAEIFIDKQSGKDFDRPEYKRLIRKLKPKDLVVIKSIDRLGRDYDEILHQWKYITRKKKADIMVIDMPLLDTRAKNNSLIRTFIIDIVLQILSYVAQTEREAIHQRQAEGIAAAKERGVKFGRKRKEVTEKFYFAVQKYMSGEFSLRKAAGYAGMPYSTFRRKYIEEKGKI